MEVSIVSGCGLVWNPDTVLKLRQDHRILGNLVGSSPKSPEMGLPLVLMGEELQLLKEKGLVKLVEIDWLRNKEQRARRASTYREESYQAQIEEFRTERKEVIIKMADKIVEGKKKKLKKTMDTKAEVTEDNISNGGAAMKIDGNELVDREMIIKQEMAKIKPITRDMAAVQIFPEDPWITDDDKLPSKWTFPFNSILSKCRLFTFKDLWNHNYYISEGSKFGGDFLVYAGDPLLYHAKYIVICVNGPEEVNVPGRSQDTVAMSRLGTSVKKIILFSWLQGDEVKYKSLKRGSVIQ